MQSAPQGPIYPLITLDGQNNSDDDWGSTYSDVFSDSFVPNFDILNHSITSDDSTLFVAVTVASSPDPALRICFYADKDGGASGVSIDAANTNPWDTQDIIVNAESSNRIDGAFCAWTDVPRGVEVFKNNAGVWSAPVPYDQPAGIFMIGTFIEFAIPLADMGLAVGDGTPAYDKGYFDAGEEASALGTTPEIFMPYNAGAVTYEIK